MEMKTTCFLEPLTSKAKKWVADHVNHEPYQTGDSVHRCSFGNRIVIEHRYIAAIVEGMEDAGLARNVDYVVS